ncbi:hypothetical protein GCM10020331_058490 [Ectobacillus funiculus]
MLSFLTLDKKRITVAHKKNVPNMVGQMTAALAEHGINIADMINRSKGGYAYTVIDIDNSFDATIKDDIATRIRSIEGVAAVRIFPIRLPRQSPHMRTLSCSSV